MVSQRERSEHLLRAKQATYATNATESRGKNRYLRHALKKGSMWEQGKGRVRRGGSSTLFSCLPGAVFKSFSVCLCSRSPSLAPTAILYVSLCFPLSPFLLRPRPFCIVQRSTRASAIFANYVTSVNSNKFLAKCLRCCCFWPPPPFFPFVRPQITSKLGAGRTC